MAMLMRIWIAALVLTSATIMSSPAVEVTGMGSPGAAARRLSGSAVQPSSTQMSHSDWSSVAYSCAARCARSGTRPRRDAVRGSAAAPGGAWSATGSCCEAA